MAFESVFWIFPNVSIPMLDLFPQHSRNKGTGYSIPERFKSNAKVKRVTKDKLDAH